METRTTLYARWRSSNPPPPPERGGGVAALPLFFVVVFSASWFFGGGGGLIAFPGNWKPFFCVLFVNDSSIYDVHVFEIAKKNPNPHLASRINILISCSGRGKLHIWYCTKQRILSFKIDRLTIASYGEAPLPVKWPMFGTQGHWAVRVV